jgi:hypothetical protein
MSPLTRIGQSIQSSQKSILLTYSLLNTLRKKNLHLLLIYPFKNHVVCAIRGNKTSLYVPLGCATHSTLTRKSRTLHSTPFAALPAPRIRRAPSLRFSVNRSRAAANASFTNALLPITAPSVK